MNFSFWPFFWFAGATPDNIYWEVFFGNDFVSESKPTVGNSGGYEIYIIISLYIYIYAEAKQKITLWFKMITGRKNYFRIIFGGSTGKSCKSPRGYYRGGLLQDRGPYRRRFSGNYSPGLLQENPVIAPGQLHEKMFTELFW